MARIKLNIGFKSFHRLEGSKDYWRWWGSRFVAEVRRVDGRAYPPHTISQLLAALQRIMLEANPNASKFCNAHNTDFRDLTWTCDSVYRRLHSEGIGTVIRHTPTFSVEDEQKLCDTGSLGIATPKALQKAALFYIGKRFCIWGGDEQQRLEPSQFQRSTDPDCYTYIEHGSKNRAGEVAELRVENKVVLCYSVLEDGEKCLVSLLYTHLNKLPAFTIEQDILYCRLKSTHLFKALGMIHLQLRVLSRACALMLEFLFVLTTLCVLLAQLPCPRQVFWSI